MTRLFNDPRAFKDEMVDGFIAANRRYLRRVPDASGVVAAGAPAAGQVAVVIGGGSGHYPAFYGLVGEALPPPPRSETSSRHPPASSAIE